MIAALMAETYRSCTIFALALLASGCGQEDASPGPGPTSADEARALAEAAEMIEEARTTPAPSHAPEEADAQPDPPDQAP